MHGVFFFLANFRTVQTKQKLENFGTLCFFFGENSQKFQEYKIWEENPGRSMFKIFYFHI
jgi:hypothetical protein